MSFAVFASQTAPGTSPNIRTATTLSQIATRLSNTVYLRCFLAWTTTEDALHRPTSTCLVKGNTWACSLPLDSRPALPVSPREAYPAKETVQQFQETLSKSPKDPAALEGAAVTLVELGEYQRASSLLEKLIKERPGNVDAYRLLGEVKYELKDYEGSASAYRSCLSITKSLDFDVLRGITNALLAARKPDEAVQVLLSSRENIDDAETIGLKDSSVQLNEVDRKSQGIDPIQVELLLGKAYSDWGHVGDAVAVYDQLISKYPNDFRGYLAKGIILKENGKAGDAERMFIQARFFAPEKAKSLVDRYSRQ